MNATHTWPQFRSTLKLDMAKLRALVGPLRQAASCKCSAAHAAPAACACMQLLACCPAVSRFFSLKQAGQELYNS